MYSCIVVGTDGSETAHVAVQSAVRLAKAVSAEVAIVGAYAPVAEARQQVEAEDAPDDVQWKIGPSEEADAALDSAAAEAQVAGVTAAKYAREGDPASAAPGRSPGIPVTNKAINQQLREAESLPRMVTPAMTRPAGVSATVAR